MRVIDKKGCELRRHYSGFRGSAQAGIMSKKNDSKQVFSLFLRNWGKVDGTLLIFSPCSVCSVEKMPQTNRPPRAQVGVILLLSCI